MFRSTDQNNLEVERLEVFCVWNYNYFGKILANEEFHDIQEISLKPDILYQRMVEFDRKLGGTGVQNMALQY